MEHVRGGAARSALGRALDRYKRSRAANASSRTDGAVEAGLPAAAPARAAASSPAAGSLPCRAATCTAAAMRSGGAAPPQRRARADQPGRDPSVSLAPLTIASCRASAKRHAPATSDPSVCVRRASEAAAAATNSGSGPPRERDQTTTGAARVSGPASSAPAVAARYQGRSVGGTSRRATRSISRPEAAAMSARTRAGSRPRGPRRGPATIAPTLRSSGIAARGGRARATRRSSPARASAARSVSVRLDEASTS
ncbi:MAG: hypothetical protein DMD43_10380 [Gemmatimonadetes bacterium]|nr:MAG: hypothetical protein DMD43_10380 [Gemmatimonadota bacterium]